MSQLQALADRYGVGSDEPARVARAIDRVIDKAEATIARLTQGAATANLYAGELEAARRDLRFAITDRALLGLADEEATAAE